MAGDDGVGIVIARRAREMCERTEVEVRFKEVHGKTEVTVEPFSGRLIVALWILLALLVFGGAALFVWMNRSLPHA